MLYKNRLVMRVKEMITADESGRNFDNFSPLYLYKKCIGKTNKNLNFDFEV